MLTRANRPPQTTWDALVSPSISLALYGISAVQRQALRTNVHSLANGSTARSLRAPLTEQVGSAPRTLAPLNP